MGWQWEAPWKPRYNAVNERGSKAVKCLTSSRFEALCNCCCVNFRAMFYLQKLTYRLLTYRQQFICQPWSQRGSSKFLSSWRRAIPILRLATFFPGLERNFAGVRPRRSGELKCCMCERELITCQEVLKKHLIKGQFSGSSHLQISLSNETDWPSLARQWLSTIF